MYKEKPGPATLRSTGNACLSYSLRLRPSPVFLRRNWTAILDIHERKLSTMSAAAVHDEHRQAGNELTAGREQQLKKWNTTSATALRNFIETQHEYRHRPPQIQVTRVVIKHRNPLATAQVATPVATPNNASDPDWLEEKLHCKGIVSGTNGLIRTQPFSGSLEFIDKQWVLNFSRPLLVDVLIHHRQSANASHEVVRSSDSLQTLDSDGALGLRIRLYTTKQALASLGLQGAAQVTNIADEHDAREMAALEAQGTEAVVFDTGAKIEMTSETASSMTARLNYQALEMDLDCRWRIDASSDLEAFNQRTTKRRRIEVPSVPTHQVIYLFQHKTQWTVDNLRCPLCGTTYDYEQFKRLHLHFLAHHDHFSVDVEQCRPGVMLVRLDLADRKPGRANIHDDDTEKINWIAPKEPFDVDKHLAGHDRAWTAEKQESLARPTRQKARNGKPRKVAQAQAIQPVDKMYKRLPPDQVKELPPRIKVSHRVPDVFAPDGTRVQFFRTNSKRPFNSGEMVENSDDEVDDSWIKERRRQNLEKIIGPKLTQGAAEFRADWDTHVDLEALHGVSGDKLMRDSTIRFARTLGARLRSDEYRAEWLEKIARMQKWNLFDQDDVAYCIDQIRLARSVANDGTATEVAGKDDKPESVNQPATPARTDSAESGIRNVANMSARRSHPLNGGHGISPVQRQQAEVI